MSSEDIIFVDLQGFKSKDNQFIVKELAIATKEHTQVFLVKPPYAYSTLSQEEKKQVKWLEINRGIFWSEGFIDYREFKRIIPSYLQNKNIFVKGLEKIYWIKDLCKNCNVIEIPGCVNLSLLQNEYSTNSFNCINHKKQCALKNVLCLSKWYYSNHMYQFNFFTK